MKRYRLFAIIVMALSMMTVTSEKIFAQEDTIAPAPLSFEEKKVVVDSIISHWNDWQRVSLSGKLKMRGLPLTPSVKIFMERDSSIMISLRAPFMGEVGRAEIVGDTLTIVNKMKKTYVRESLDSVLSHYPVALSSVQDMLLGRVIIPGFGVLSEGSEAVVEIFPEEESRFTLIPSEAYEIDGFNYGYLIDGMALPEVLMVVPAAKPEINVSMTYSFYDSGYDFTLTYQKDDKAISGTLQLSNPDWDGQSMDPIRIDDRYRKMDLSDFIKSF